MPSKFDTDRSLTPPGMRVFQAFRDVGGRAILVPNYFRGSHTKSDILLDRYPEHNPKNILTEQISCP